MQNRRIGTVLIIIGLLATLMLYGMHLQEEQYIDTITDIQGGTCFLDDGTCLHADRDLSVYFLGGILASTLLVLGLYLRFFDRTPEMLMRQHREVSHALKAAKEKDEFKAYLGGFNENERKVLAAVHEQEGIKQSTLRYKTGIAKTSLSLLLKDLQERDIITRKEDGKTNKVFLRKKF